VSVANLSFRQQVVLALLNRPKDWMPVFKDMNAAVKFLDEEELPANDGKAVQVGARCLAVVLDIYVDSIVKQFGEN
jgi:hypothetical protein